MSNIEIFDEKLVSESTTAPDASKGSACTGIDSQERIKQNSIVEKIAAAMKSVPTIIGEIAEIKKLGLELHIPLGGSDWINLAAKTGLKTAYEMKEKLRTIAAEESLDIAFGESDDGMGSTAKITKKKGIKYEKPMSRENRIFISCFESEVIPDPDFQEKI